MIHRFPAAPAEAGLRRHAATAVSLALHALLLALLLVPVGVAVKQGLLDRLAVYLVPPDLPSGNASPQGEAAFAAVRSRAGTAARAPLARPTTDTPNPNASRGELPLLSAVALQAATRPRAADHALTELEVDSAAVRDPASAAPEYPPALLKRGFEGFAAVLYVVDTLGTVDTVTYRVIAASHPDFAGAVRRALPEMHFRPALQQGHRVRQLVQQTFRFRVTLRDTLPTPRPPQPTA